MKAIVMLFKTDNGSENFIYPNIEKVNINIEGIPGSVWNQGLEKTRMFEEAKGFFAKDCVETIGIDPHDFFCDNKFALVVDLRSLSDSYRTGTGRKLLNTQSGIQLEMSKKATKKDVTCHVYVIADGLLNIVDGELGSIYY